MLEEINKAATATSRAATSNARRPCPLGRGEVAGVDASTIVQKGRELAAVRGDRAANVAAALIFSDEARAIYVPLAPPRGTRRLRGSHISVLGR